MRRRGSGKGRSGGIPRDGSLDLGTGDFPAEASTVTPESPSYVDGTSRFTAGAMAGSVSSAGELLLGKATGYGYLSGDLDEAVVYPAILSAARVQAHWEVGRFGSP